MRRLAPLLVALALVLYWVMAVSVSPRNGVTADEVVHLTGGYTYWKFNDYRMHPENGTLPMRLAALPLLTMGLKTPPLTDPDWLNSKVNLYGEKFFFEQGNPVDAMLLRARMVIALTGVFTAWLTWRWARGLFGAAAGWLALGLAVFCPAMLAHGGLATSDMTMTACVLGALSAVWRLLHRATWGRLAVATAACGLAFLSKMSGVLIVPLIGALVVLRWLRPAPLVLALGARVRWLRRRGGKAWATLALTSVVGAGSLVLLWAGYGFRFDGFNRAVSGTNGYYFTWDVILDKQPVPWPAGSLLDDLHGRLPLRETAMTKLIGTLRDHRLLPEAYLWGFAHTYKFSRSRLAFFLGDYRSDGWRMFFPTAFLLKTTLPALLLIAAGVAALVWAGRAPPGAPRRVRPWMYRAAPLLLFFAVYWVMAINLHLNIGHRHILPTYPVFYVLASASALWLQRARRAVTLALAAALALHAGDSLWARPFYLSYFQPLVGGEARGYRYLVDSSYDWGQGLPDLARWLQDKAARGDRTPVYLTYFGADSPRARGLDVIRFGDEVSDAGPRVFPAQVHGGWFVISATDYTRVYMPTRGPWTDQYEKLYRTLAARLTAAQARGDNLTAAEHAQLVQDAMDYEMVQFGRLSWSLQGREPLEVLGGSMLVFRLTDAEVQAALYGPVRPAR